VAGVDDRYCGKPNVKQAIASIPNEPEPCLLMLLHNPLLFDMVIRDCHLPVDLALAGHTHAGHVYIPILWPIYRYVLHHKYRYGFFERGKHRLYVTSGVGSAAFYFFKKSLQLGLPRFRWNTQPEIAYFDLSPAVN
jgi:predicted MPP superfamily phosphohydrolase